MGLRKPVRRAYRGIESSKSSRLRKSKLSAEHGKQKFFSIIFMPEIIAQNQFLILLAVIALIAGVGGWFLFGIQKKIKLLFGGRPPKSHEEMYRDALRRIAELEAVTADIESRLKIAEAISRASIQKVGFMRFNPFNDTGGNNSFIIAMLDHNNSGIVISSLYMREGTRLYAKEITNGVSKQQLSGEEKRVVEEAMRQNF